MGVNAMKMLLNILFLAVITLLVAGCSMMSVRTDLEETRKEAYQAYHTGNYPTAIEKFESLIQQIPKDAELWFRLGNAYARAKQPQKAISAYENALLRNPRLAKAWYNLGLIHMQSALQVFAEMRQYVPDNDPVGREGKAMLDGLTRLLDGPDSLVKKTEEQ